MKHLTVKQRYQIEVLYAQYPRVTQKQISKQLGITESQLSRELKRNKMQDGKYKAENAQQYTDFRHHTKPKKKRLTASLVATTL